LFAVTTTVFFAACTYCFTILPISLCRASQCLIYYESYGTNNMPKRNYYRILVRELADNVSVTRTYMGECYQKESDGNIVCWEWTELAQ